MLRAFAIGLALFGFGFLDSATGSAPEAFLHHDPVAHAASSPYPASEVITSFTIDLASYNRLGHGDNWPTTWAADGEQYTIFADGNGFNGGTDQTFGWAQTSGDSGASGQWSGSEPPSNGNLPAGYGSGGRKASGLIQVNGVFYAAVRNLSGENGSNLRRSLDGGLNWEWATWSWPQFGYPFFANMGQNYSANRDGFVYLYSTTTSNAYDVADGLWLARAPKSDLFSQSAWTYFAGMDPNGAPFWSENIADRAPVFSFPGHTYRPSIVYNPGLDRYLLSIANRTSEGLSAADSVYVFDAPSPWGPWSTVYENEAFSSLWPESWDAEPFHAHFPPKWISPDGRTMYLAWSCYPCGQFYALNVAKVSMTAANGAPSLPAIDTDDDGWSDAGELAIGTDRLYACPAYPGHDAWPPDLNGDGFSDMSDTTTMLATEIGTFLPGSDRYDLAPDPPDGFIDTSDFGQLNSFFGRGCPD